MTDKHEDGDREKTENLTYKDLKILAVLTGSMAISIYINGIWGLAVCVVLIYITNFYLIFFAGDVENER